MRVSQRLDYTMRALVALAASGEGASEPAGSLALRLGLPKRFVEQQMVAAAKAGVVHCRRGAGGGCSLARPASEITVGDVVRAVEGSTLDVPHVTGSAVSEAWGDIASRVDAALDSVTVEQLVARQAQIDRDSAPMYFI